MDNVILPRYTERMYICLHRWCVSPYHLNQYKPQTESRLRWHYAAHRFQSQRVYEVAVALALAAACTLGPAQPEKMPRRVADEI